MLCLNLKVFGKEFYLIIYDVRKVCGMVRNVFKGGESKNN